MSWAGYSPLSVDHNVSRLESSPFMPCFPSREPEIVFPVVRPNVRRSLFQKSVGKSVDFDSIGNTLSQLNAVQSEIDEVKDALSMAEKKCVKRTAKLQKFVNDRNHIFQWLPPEF